MNMLLGFEDFTEEKRTIELEIKKLKGKIAPICWGCKYRNGLRCNIRFMQLDELYKQDVISEKIGIDTTESIYNQLHKGFCSLCEWEN